MDVTHQDNVRMCVNMGWFHLLPTAELEAELKRLEGKQRDFMKEYIERTNTKINQIKAILNRQSLNVIEV